MEVFLKRLEIYAGDDWPSPVSRVVTGRPVHFAGARPDPDLAMQRYNEALTRLGFPELHYVYEPVAAAFYFAQNLKRDATVLVADFGGGTSDFSLIRFESRAGRISALPVGHSGVGVAGDQFDARIIDHLVAPEIGKGSQFRSFGKKLDVPGNYYSNFARWNQMSIFKTTREFADLKGLVRQAVEPDKLELFIDLVEQDEGYRLNQAVSATKVALSSQDAADFRFEPLCGAGEKQVLRPRLRNPGLPPISTASRRRWMRCWTRPVPRPTPSTSLSHRRHVVCPRRAPYLHRALCRGPHRDRRRADLDRPRPGADRRAR
ncbi:MAG: hypothetical protein HoeaKO_13340 [Hoeflea alexandrii]